MLSVVTPSKEILTYFALDLQRFAFLLEMRPHLCDTHGGFLAVVAGDVEARANLKGVGP